MPGPLTLVSSATLLEQAFLQTVMMMCPIQKDLIWELAAVGQRRQKIWTFMGTILAWAMAQEAMDMKLETMQMTQHMIAFMQPGLCLKKKF